MDYLQIDLLNQPTQAETRVNRTETFEVLAIERGEHTRPFYTGTLNDTAYRAC